MEKLQILLQHDFIANQQATFLQERKLNLQPGEVIVLCDFSENYSFVLQDAVQGFHWNNEQATIHPFVCYYRPQNLQQFHHLSYVVISDCRTHDTIAFHVFQKHLIALLKNHIGSLEKMYYFSDGAASHYKNKKNFMNVCHHKSDFQVAAEWHFFATSHGKGPCDGIGGSLKRLAARSSLQRPYEEQIMTPKDLFDWAEKNLTSSFFTFVPNEEVERERNFLKHRYNGLRPIPGTRSLHAFIPTSEYSGIMRLTSFSAEGQIVTLVP